MTKIDMKYTSLFWKLGFVEETTDSYTKNYKDSHRIDIEAEKQIVNYRFKKKTDDFPNALCEHKDFVILECVNRLLEKGFDPDDLLLTSGTVKHEKPDIIILDKVNIPLIAFDCKRWGGDFEEELVNVKKGSGLLFSYFKKHKKVRYLCLYTSRLDGGILEYKNAILTTVNYDNKIYFIGIFEENLKPYKPILSLSEKEKKNNFNKIKLELIKNSDNFDFLIENDVLVKYQGREKNIKIPNSIKKIGIGAFWNCTSLIAVEIPNGLEIIGGDAFYYCHNLKSLNIPKSVQIIGNDPFAACPLLTLTNESPNFILNEGVLYNKEKDTLIHYPINNSSKKFVIPDGVKYIGKHAFYNCINLKSITIPQSVLCIENNAFADCKNLTLTNRGSNFALEDGVLYNNEKTQLISLIDHQLEILDIPNSVMTIGKNAFWNCVNLKRVSIPKSMTRIGYNPFAGCNSLILKNNSPYFTLKDGVLYNKEITEIIYFPNTSISKKISIPSSVTSIGRNSFTYCVNLEELIIPPNVTTIERGAFSGCLNLSFIVIPESVEFIGKWAFSYCKSLKTIKISKKTVIEDFAFAECQVKLTLLV